MSILNVFSVSLISSLDWMINILYTDVSCCQALTSVVNFREPKSICKAPELVSATRTNTSHVRLRSIIDKYRFFFFSSPLPSSWPNTVTIS